MFRVKRFGENGKTNNNKKKKRVGPFAEIPVLIFGIVCRIISRLNTRPGCRGAGSFLVYNTYHALKLLALHTVFV